MAYQFWTTTQIKFLKDSAESIPAQKIARHLNRSPRAVFQKAKDLELKLICMHCNTRWTEEHLGLLDSHTVAQVAKLTGRTYDAVWQKMNQRRQKLAT